MVLPKEEFEEVVKYQFGGKRTVLGFVGFFATELGRMPFILKGNENKRTTWHEDVHVFREKMGLSYPFRHDMSSVVQRPEVLRAVEATDIQPDDLEVNEQIINLILFDARQTNREELATSLWVGEMPVIGEIDKPSEDTDLGFMYVNFLNCLYSEASGLTEEQILKRHFDLEQKFNEVNLERARMYVAARQAIKGSRGVRNPWGLAAARATVTPPNFSPRLFETIMFGRGVELIEEPKIHKGIGLAAVLAIHARRAVHPEPYGQGGEISKELIPTLVGKLIQIVNIERKFAPIIEDNNLDADDLKDAKTWLIKIIRKSVPAGSRSQIERDLDQSLIF